MEVCKRSFCPKLHVKTYNPLQEFFFKWTIENYSKIPYDDLKRGPKFTVESESTWYVSLKKRQHYICFYVHRRCDVFPVDVSYKFAVTDCEGKKYYGVESEYVCDENDFKIDIAEKAVHWKTIINSLNNAKNDTLVFTVFFKVLLPYVTKVVNCTLTAERVQRELQRTLSDDLKRFLDNGTSTDVVLMVNEQKMNAHKAILSARSTIFARMFQQDGMVETKYNVVKIDDVTMPVLRELVTFLYSAQIKNYDFQTALDLYYAADKYDVLELRELCSGILASMVTLKDAPKLLYLADLHQDAGLKDKVIQFIKSNDNPI